MKIFILEDDVFKREQITDFLESKKIQFDWFEYMCPALRYVVRNKEEISGIILDLGLQNYKDSSSTYDLYKGLEFIEELDRKKIYIPILINSSTEVGMLDEYPFVYGQRTKIDNYQILESFIAFLEQREKQ